MQNTPLVMVTLCCLLTPLNVRAADHCQHGVVCVKENPGPDLLMEARAGYAFHGNGGPAVEATLGVGDLGLGIPQNILFIGEVGFTGGLPQEGEGADPSEVTMKTYDVSGGVRAYWPTRGRFSVFGDVLFGGANHSLEDRFSALSTDQWTFMGQLALGLELHLFRGLSLVGRFKATVFGASALMLASAMSNSSSVQYMGAPVERGRVETLRLTGTAGVSWCF